MFPSPRFTQRSYRLSFHLWPCQQSEAGQALLGSAPWSFCSSLDVLGSVDWYRAHPASAEDS